MGTNTVKYGSRGFAQDAANAMKGDIVRGLIELITNCDDAYEQGQDGKILIEFERRRRDSSILVVRDRARGMSKATLVQVMGQVGSRTSGFEDGREVRGNLGRGAKDLAAFGNVTFETVKDDRYSKMVLEPNGTYDDLVEHRVTNEEREHLGIQRGNGTVVTVEVGTRFRVPQTDRLIEKLSNHFQLRDINSDSKRDVVFVDVNSGSRSMVRFDRPIVEEVEALEAEVPGYEGAAVSIQVQKLSERGDSSTTDTSRPEGLLLKGSRAVYENTLFKYEANPAAHWFTGVVKCQYIDELARKYDDESEHDHEHSSANPMPIISRSRDGLEKEHPFYQALAELVEGTLLPYVEEEERKARESGSRETTQLRRDFESLGRDLGQLIDSDLREIDEDGIPGGAGAEGNPDIYLIPGSPVLYMNENKTVSVVVSISLGVDSITVELDPEGVVELIDSAEIPLAPHPRREDYLIGRIRLRPLIEDEETSMTIKAGTVELGALVQVHPERENPASDPPITFEFERQQFHLTVGKRRKLLLRAPVEVINAAGGTSVRVTSSGPGVAVLGSSISLVFDEEQVCFIGRVEVDPRQLGASERLTAVLGGTLAECDVVAGRFEGDGPSLHFELVDQEMGHFRAWVEDEAGGMKINILGANKALKRYLGPGPDFPNQNTPQARAVIAEIIAGEAARLVVQRKFRSAGELDGPAFYAEHLEYLDKYLRRCHVVMVGEALGE
jgi:hypothetical protein